MRMESKHITVKYQKTQEKEVREKREINDNKTYGKQNGKSKFFSTSSYFKCSWFELPNQKRYMSWLNR